MIVNLFEKAVAAALRAERVASREFSEFVHGLKELAHVAKEFGEELMRDDDSEFISKEPTRRFCTAQGCWPDKVAPSRTWVAASIAFPHGGPRRVAVSPSAGEN
jgi:hypothetical protein